MSGSQDFITTTVNCNILPPPPEPEPKLTLDDIIPDFQPKKKRIRRNGVPISDTPQTIRTNTPSPPRNSPVLDAADVPRSYKARRKVMQKVAKIKERYKKTRN